MGESENSEGGATGRGWWVAPDDVTGVVKAPPAVMWYPAYVAVPGTCRKGIKLFLPQATDNMVGKALGSDQNALVLVCCVA